MTENSLSFNSSDFLIEGSHARMSQRKVAEVIGISHTSVQKWVGNLTDATEAEALTARGFDGGNLNKIVGYYATSKSVSQEVRERCVSLLIESSKVGFQLYIDQLAGLTNEPNVIAIPSAKQQVDDFCFTIDCIFSGLNIEQALIAGIKLNAAKQLMPSLATQLEQSRQLLINSTAKESKLMTVTELGKLLNPPLSAKAVNLKLINGGWQVKNTNKKSKKDPAYLPTDKAKDHCSFVLSTDSQRTDTYNQLRWYDTILSLI